VSDRGLLRELDDAGLLLCLQGRPRPPREARMEVYAEITRRYEPRVLKLLGYLLNGDAEAVLDIGQESFLDVVVYLEKATAYPDPEGLGRWLNTFARNRAKKYVAKETAWKGRKEEWTQRFMGGKDDMVAAQVTRDPSKLPGDDPIRRAEVFRILDEVIVLLPPKEQAIAQLRFGEELGSAEIAARLGMPAGTAANKCTDVQAAVVDLFCTWLLVHGDRTRCPTLGKILESHEQRHGKALTAGLATAVRTHYSVCKNCTTAREQPVRCPHGAPVTECRRCPVCPHGNNCRSCDIARKRLLRDYGPVLIPIVFAAEFHERVSQAISEAGYRIPAPGSGAAVKQRGTSRSLRRRLIRTGATVAAIAIVVFAGRAFFPGALPRSTKIRAQDQAASAIATEMAAKRFVSLDINARNIGDPAWFVGQARIDMTAKGTAAAATHVMYDSGEGHTWFPPNVVLIGDRAYVTPDNGTGANPPPESIRRYWEPRRQQCLANPLARLPRLHHRTAEGCRTVH
jgi:RNA polymerase sigma factor (sigma-70 family)